MSDLFVLGAGFSKAVYPEMPLLGELGKRLQGSAQNVVSEMMLLSSFNDDVELWLTYLTQNHPWLDEATNLRNRAYFLDATKTLRQFLDLEVTEAERLGFPAWFQGLVGYWHEHRSCVVTFNYDVLVERCLMKTKFPLTFTLPPSLYPVPFATPSQRTGLSRGSTDLTETFTLAKLHGSTNWFYSGREQGSTEPIYVSDFEEGKPTGAEGFLRLPGAREHYLPTGVKDLVPFIVPPLTDKLPYFENQLVRTLWKRAARMLGDATRVFFLGYSLPPTDLTVRFWLACGGLHLPSLAFVVNRDSNAVERYEALLSAQKYKIRSDYAGIDDPIPKFVEDLIGDRLHPKVWP